MRTITGYDSVVQQPGRSTAIEVILTPMGGTPMDVSAIVRSLRVSDTLERRPSEATVEFSRKTEEWSDPFVASSPLAAGGRLSISMGERGGVLTRIFDGEIVGGSTSSEDPVAHGPLRAVGGYHTWWRRPITSGVYSSEDSDDIIDDLFQTWGNLGAEDFDLPGDGITLRRLQVVERTLMDVAYDIYAPAEHVPWWDPVRRKLATLSSTIPVTADLILSNHLRGHLSMGWNAPEATRIYLHGGTLQGEVRIEIGPWTTPHNILTDYRQEGVRWASGSKTDWANPPYWADANDTVPSRHTGTYNPGEYLWIEFLYDWAPTTGTGYRGPEGVRFLQNNPLVSTDPVSTVEIRVEAGTPWADILGFVTTERWDADDEIMLCHVKLRLDVALWVPGPAGYTPGDYWQLILDDTDLTISWDIKGRQMAQSALNQLSAQDWAVDLLATFGDRIREEHNDALLVEGTERASVEAESQRLLSVASKLRYPATVDLVAQDLRLLPGDCVQTPHPRDAYAVLLWAHRVEHTWGSSGIGHTSLSGYVVGTVGDG